MPRHFVRCLADHQVIGSIAVNEHGQPLSEIEARKIAIADNKREQRRRELTGKKVGFEFIAVTV